MALSGPSGCLGIDADHDDPRLEVGGGRDGGYHSGRQDVRDLR